MKDQTKTKKQLIEELEVLRRQSGELKKAGEAIVQVRREWEDIFQAISHPTIILDAQHNILSINRATVKAAGAHSAEELIGRKCYEIFHNTSEPPEGCPLTKILSSTKLETNEMEVEALGGVFLVSCTPVFDEKGNIQKIIHIATDITERKRAEAVLRENEAFIKAVLDNIPVGVAVNSVDPTVTFNYMNDNFHRFYRTTREKLSDPDAFWSVVYEDPAFREEIKKRVLDDCASGNPERMYWADVPITRKGEETFFITARNIPVPDKPLMISTVWDVTERKKAEEELKKRVKELEDFYEMAVGRELRMIELKEQMEELKEELSKYKKTQDE